VKGWRTAIERFPSGAICRICGFVFTLASQPSTINRPAMHRFYLSPNVWNASSPVLDEGESHHVLNVLRFGAGDHVTVFDGEGSEARGDIVSIEGGKVILRIGPKLGSQPLGCAITLAQATQGEAMDSCSESDRARGRGRCAAISDAQLCSWR
jgi:hypothetical protein